MPLGAGTPIPYPLVNGVRHSFVSIELKLFGNIFIGFKKIDYSRKRSRTIVRGNHPDPIGKTRGDNDYQCSAEIYLAEWNLFQAQTQEAKGGNLGYGDQFGTILVTYASPGFDTIQDTILGCTIDTTEASQSQGADPLSRTIDFSPLKILFNSLDDVEVALQAPTT